MTCQIVTVPRLVDAVDVIIDSVDDYKTVIDDMVKLFNKHQIVNDDTLDTIVNKLTDDIPAINGTRFCDEQINYHMNLYTLQQCIIDLYNGLFEPIYIMNRNIGRVVYLTNLRIFHGAIVFEIDGVRITPY